jgi:hypothetical protein
MDQQEYLILVGFSKNKEDIEVLLNAKKYNL